MISAPPEMSGCHLLHWRELIAFCSTGELLVICFIGESEIEIWMLFDQLVEIRMTVSPIAREGCHVLERAVHVTGCSNWDIRSLLSST